MDKPGIESKTRDLQQLIWAQRASLWPDRDPHPLEVIDPEIAAHAIGVNFQYLEELKFDFNDNKYETAGLLNRPGRQIYVARRFGPEVMRFTGAHELGHWILHPSSVTLHRDLPVKGLEREAQDPREREADYFAACFLMPAKLVKSIFGAMFRTNNPFVFDEATAFHLRPGDSESLVRPHADSYEREVTLARARSFAGRHFEKSLAELFQVSTATMAIRIRELKLVRLWP